MKSIALGVQLLPAFPRMAFGLSDSLSNGETATAGLPPDRRLKPVCSRCQCRAPGVRSHHQRTCFCVPVQKAWMSSHYRKAECRVCERYRGEELSVAEPPGGPGVTRLSVQYT
jgi:hypothetical protein